ncbi:MAG TPA: M48 family metallopeptidase [Burkholderiales bacterium]|nr:M48 family metallopeptidase [Burkholderiales bacterium]
MGIKLGKMLHEAIHDAYVVEATGWAVEQVTRVANRLQADVEERERLLVEVPWIERSTAFAAPGRYIYVSRRLLEICRTDEAVAFVIAHELAHHRLGHLETLPDWMADIPGSQIPFLLQGLYRNIEARLYGPEAEVEADLLAIDLCIKAGYDAKKCLEIFDTLERIALDMRDVDIVFGPDEADDELDKDASLSTKLRIWLWQRTRGYLPLRDRRHEILRHLEEGTAA